MWVLWTVRVKRVPWASQHLCEYVIVQLTTCGKIFQNNSSSYDAPEGNRLSDVVRGTATHTSVRSEEGKAVTAPSAAVPATVSTCSVSAAACALTHPAASAITSAILTTVPVSSTASGNKEEKDWGGKKSVAPSVTSACAKSVSTQSPVVVST